LQRRTLSVSLYLLVLIISILLGSQNEVIIGVVLVINSGFLFLLGLLVAKAIIGSRQELIGLLNSNRYEHIIMPLALLWSLLMGRVVLFWSPAWGLLIIGALEPTAAVISLVWSSCTLGTLCFYSMHQSTPRNLTSE
jgi:hypothetical protein